LIQNISGRRLERGIAVYDILKKLAARPEPYSLMTVRELWTRPHIARQMLAYHLDQDTSLASRPIALIEEIADWLDKELGLEGKRICDLGCGPGLYSSRLAARGASVTGVDFSPTAIAYAESHVPTTDSKLDYLVADYLHDELPRGFDVVTLIYYDFCALSPADRQALLRRIRSMLNPAGCLVMDVVATAALAGVREQLTLEERLMGGFWSGSDYVGIHRTWVYPGEALSLDHYVIVEPSSHWEILNWMQFFSPDRLAGELEEAGFTIRALAGSLAGAMLTKESTEIGAIAQVGIEAPQG
jgi:2-polyprenyl-3-methyl-5-hydroxy-6-metoxy-1,4-benzoquinol methylase